MTVEANAPAPLASDSEIVAIFLRQRHDEDEMVASLRRDTNEIDAIERNIREGIDAAIKQDAGWVWVVCKARSIGWKRLRDCRCVTATSWRSSRRPSRSRTSCSIRLQAGSKRRRP